MNAETKKQYRTKLRTAVTTWANDPDGSLLKDQCYANPDEVIAKVIKQTMDDNTVDPNDPTAGYAAFGSLEVDCIQEKAGHSDAAVERISYDPDNPQASNFKLTWVGRSCS